MSRMPGAAPPAVADLAADLLKIQASREAQPGHSYSEDTPWQREFEGSFPYEETRDQWSAIQSAKQDMERPRPMDRLICGDVGFGKTEVAIRAAFKAVMGGRQVAVLVPTTVLAQQHYNTFRERMAEFPISVELLSRFRSKKQADATIDGLATGSVDIVVGTHKLIQKNVRFKELGLVIIDEEQRFGVLHKEKLKILRQTVDVLTLTATPIPRTLHMALTGARDMSTIETPPQDRLPIETTVIEFDEKIIRNAIQRELNRGGQIFFLHNRVTTIETMAERIRKLVPKARLIVGHGQMPSGVLEKVMTRFINGEADILLSTTIIEEVLRDKAAVLSSDASVDSRFQGAHSIIMQGIRSSMAVPLLHREEVFGIMMLDSQIAANAFTEKDLQLFQNVANQAAIAVQNSLYAKKPLEILVFAFLPDHEIAVRAARSSARAASTAASTAVVSGGGAGSARERLARAAASNAWKPRRFGADRVARFSAAANRSGAAARRAATIASRGGGGSAGTRVASSDSCKFATRSKRACRRAARSRRTT